MDIKLEPRLKKITDLVGDFNYLADIGTDHGYIPVVMIQKKRIKKAIACDINIKPLNKAKKLVAKKKLEMFIETRLGSGLSVLDPGEAETIVMAGMGGHLISELLNDGKEVAQSTKELILQPMSVPNYLRHFLEDHQYVILEEALVQEGQRIYEIIRVRPGSMIMKDALEYELGYRYWENQDPLLKVLINRKLELEKRILRETEKKMTALAQEQFVSSRNYIKALEEALICR